MFQCWFEIYSYIDLWEYTLWVLLLWRSFTKIGLVDYSLHFSLLHVISSRCQESQREAALLLGQFATTDPECKVGIFYLFRCSFLLPACTEFFKFNWWLFGGFCFLLLFVLPLLGFLCQFLFFNDFLSSPSLCLPISAELLTNTHYVGSSMTCTSSLARSWQNQWAVYGS